MVKPWLGRTKDGSKSFSFSTESSRLSVGCSMPGAFLLLPFGLKRNREILVLLCGSILLSDNVRPPNKLILTFGMTGGVNPFPSGYTRDSSIRW